MYLYTAVDDRTVKSTWSWDFNGCKECEFRFECFTDDRIHVKPVKIGIIASGNFYRYWEEFKAEFHLPKCLRLGLYKQLSDTSIWNSGYGEFGDGFKLGNIVKEEGEHISVNRSWVKFPNILYVTGHVR